VIFRSIPDAATRLNELVTGGVQLIQDPPVDQLDRITGAGGRVATTADGRRYVIWISMDGKGALAENPQKTADQKKALEALAKPAVREALNVAVDRQTIIDTLLDGKGEAMTNILVKPDLGFDASIAPFRYDPDRARQLLKDAGYGGGFSVDLDVCTCDRSDLPEAVVGELAKIGVKATIKPFEVSTFNSDWSSGKTDPLRASRLSFSDPNVYLQLWLRSGGLLSRYGNPAVDALIDQQAAEYDATKRAMTIGQIAKLTRTDLPAIFLWSSPNLYGVAKTVPDWSPTLLGYLPVTGVAVTGG
jgi:peptide/nickel transport system substrate-binding protein